MRRHLKRLCPFCRFLIRAAAGSPGPVAQRRRFPGDQGAKEAHMGHHRHRRIRWLAVQRVVSLLGSVAAEVAKVIDALRSGR